MLPVQQTDSFGIFFTYKKSVMMKNKYSLKWPALCLLLAQLPWQPAQADDGVFGAHQDGVPAKYRMAAPQIPGKQMMTMPGTAGLYFIENKGQITDQHGQQRNDIDFRLVTGTNVNVFIGSGNVHYQWNSVNPDNGQVHSYRMDLSVLGANKNAEIVQEEQQDYYEQYYKGNDKARAFAYNKITYKNIYPQIDWVLYMKGQTFEYDFVIHPGGRVSDIRLQYDGAQSVRLNKDGSVTAHTPAGSVTEQAPYSFQKDGKEIASRFHLSGNRLSFKTANYNARETFIIDPVVEWATYYGGIGPGYSYELFPGYIVDVAEWDIGSATAFDNDLNVYFTGYTNSLTNIATTGAHQQTWGGSADTISAPEDAFLVKFDATGKRVWATYYGGQGTESGNGITCDEFGNVYIAGGSTSTDVNLASQNSHQGTLNGTSDAFIAKFDGNGTRIWATYFGGPGTETAAAIVSDKGGHIYISGNTASTSGLAHGTIHQDTNGGGQDAFVAKFTESGSLEWATYFGGAGTDEGRSLAWDAQNQIVYLGGQTNTSTNLGTPNVHQDTFAGAGDAFVARFTVQGQREWSTYFGGDGLDHGIDIEVDDAGNIYLTGLTMSKTLATPGSFLDTIATIGSFLTKFFPDGTRDWTTYAPGNSLYVAVSGLSIYIGGQTADTAGVATPGAPFDTLIGASDVYMMKFDTTGVREWGTYFGSSANDNGGYLDCDGYGNIYLSGRATVPSAITGGIGLATPGAHQDTFATGGNPGAWDAFLAKFSDCVQDLAITIDSLTMGVTGSSVYKNFQWYKDGAPISGATDSTYTATENAMYSVSVASALNGCLDSAWYEITNIVEDDDDDDVSVSMHTNAKQIKVFPNPAHNMIYIQAPSPVNVQLKSVEGKLVLQQQSVTSVDISGIASGMYLLSITDKDGQVIHTEKLIKERQ